MKKIFGVYNSVKGKRNGTSRPRSRRMFLGSGFSVIY